MGRLFWKFFLFVWLAQLVTIIGVGIAIDAKHRGQDEFRNRPPPGDLMDQAANLLRYGGKEAALGLLRTPRAAGLLILDASGTELLGRPPAPDGHGRSMTVSAPDGQNYVLRALAGHPGGHPGPGFGPPAGPEHHSHLPWEPLLGGVVASVISAALLAWYIAKPIRHLRTAFANAATGNLTLRIADAMGRRRDELADLGRDFDRMADQLGALMGGQRRLLHDVSHELRSPLARLQAAIGLARQQPDKVLASMERIERESVRMDRLVGELLTLSRLDAGVAGALDESVDMGELVGGIVDDAGFEAEAMGRRLDYQDGGSAQVQGKAELLHRALENVIRNAIRYSPDGASVTVATAWDTAGYGIRVSDQGPGVVEAELESIFEPFYRSANNAHPDGHGLGLAIAKRVVEAHGGSICARNRAQGGLEVAISLPALKLSADAR